MKKEEMTAEEMESLFEQGDKRYLEYFDMSTIRRPGTESQKVSVRLPSWMVQSLDSEAERLGITRQAIIKIWLDERLKAEAV